MQARASLGQAEGMRDRLASLVVPPGPTVCLIGVGNIGSRVAVELPLVGIKRIVLIDPDHIDCDRNGRTCSIYADRDLDGRFKVGVLADQIRTRFPEVQVFALAQSLNFVGLAGLRDYSTAIWVGAVDSRKARYELARAAIMLDRPLIDLAISSRQDQLVARARTSWTGLDGIDPLNVWSARDWQLIESRQPCGRIEITDGGNDRPVSSSISGTVAAALGLSQIQKLLSGDAKDVGWETRIDLSHGSLVRSRLPDSGSSPLQKECIVTEGSLVAVHAKTLGELVKEAEARLGLGAEVELNRRVSPGFWCGPCETEDDTPGPDAGQECESCGNALQAKIPLSGLSRDSVDPLTDAPLSSLGTDDDILLARSSDESEHIFLQYRLKPSEA